MKKIHKESSLYDSDSNEEDDNDQSDNDINYSDTDSDKNFGVKDEDNEMKYDDNDSDKETSFDNKINLNSGWADAMAKILKTNKPKRKKTIVLAKAKKLKPVNEDDNNEDKSTFEIEGNEKLEEIKTENDNISITDKSSKKIAGLEIAQRIRKKALQAKGRIKPSVLDKDREKILAKVATKGVVQLFNAVRQQQRSLEKEIQKVGPSDVKQDKVLKNVDKRAFLDVLMGAKSQTVPEIKEESKVKSEWSVLRDDFMMGTKLKDWDKEESKLNDGND